MIEIHHRFQSREEFDGVINYIRSFSPRMEDGNYVIEFDLQKMFEPLKEIFVKINYRIRRMIFQGEDEVAVRFFCYDCTFDSRYLQTR